MLSILVADDEKYIREGLNAGLQWEELQIDKVHLATDGEQALEIAQQYRIDILLTDIRMPRMDGIELSKQFRKLYPNCLIIFMSAFSDKEYLLSAIQLKCVNFIEKPLQIAILKEVIADAVHAYQDLENNRLNSIIMETDMKTSIPLIKNEIAVLAATRHADQSLLEKCAANRMLDIELKCQYITIIMDFFILPSATAVQEVARRARETLLKTILETLRANGLNCLSGTRDEVEHVFHVSSCSAANDALNPSRITFLLKDSYDRAKYKSVFFSIGTAVPDFHHIHESYSLARAALNKCFFRGYGSVVCYSADIAKSSLVDKEIMEQFNEALENGQRQILLQMMHDYSAKLQRYENVEIEEVKSLFYKLMMSILERLQVFGASDITAKATDNTLRNRIFNCNTLGEIVSYSQELIDLYFDFIKKMSGSSSITSIISYIEKNFTLSTMDINAISQNTYFSPAYLCTYFKHETGKTINQYITEYRMKKSIEFLKDKKYRISDVATLIGYVDGNYFTRLFKKRYGVSPSEYRERLGIQA